MGEEQRINFIERTESHKETDKLTRIDVLLEGIQRQMEEFAKNLEEKTKRIELLEK